MVFGMFTRGQIQWNSPWTSQLQWFYYQDVLYGGEFQILIPGYMVMVIIYIIYIYIMYIYIYIWNFGFMTIWDLRFLQIHGNPNGLHHVLRCHKARSVQCSSGTDLDCSGSKPATSQCLGMDQDQSSGWPGMAIGCHWYIPLAGERYIPWYFYIVYQDQFISSFLTGWWFGTWFSLMTFHINWECHHPNWRTHIFQRGWNHQPDETWC